jgi:hypothetical protein
LPAKVDKLLLWMVALMVGALTVACGRSHAAPLRPDLAGTWDVVYDDYLDVEVIDGEHVQTLRIGREGGLTRTADAGTLLRIDVACARDEVLCPQEIWGPTLALTNRVGDVDDDGEAFSVSLRGEGRGPCTLGPASIALADLATEGRGASYQGTSLTGGRITTDLPLSCFAEFGLTTARRSDVRVRLSTGFSAVRR